MPPDPAYVRGLAGALRRLYRVLLDGRADMAGCTRRQLEREIGRLAWLDQQLAVAPREVLFVGKTNVGKSTLLSALLGAEVAPRRNMAFTACPVRYRHAQQYEAEVRLRGSTVPLRGTFGDADGLARFVKAFGTEDGDRRDSRTVGLDVRLPSELLMSGLVLVDSPGTGAVGDPRRAARVRRELAVAAQFVFVVVQSRRIEQSELRAIGALPPYSCMDCVVNCFDDWGDTERDQFVACYGRYVDPFMRWHFVSARKALAIRVKGQDGVLAGSGLDGLERRLRQIADGDDAMDQLRTWCRGTFRWIGESRVLPGGRWPLVPVAQVLAAAGQVDTRIAAEFHDELGAAGRLPDAGLQELPCTTSPRGE